MSQFKYDGEGERVIAMLGIVVNTGDVFEAPDDFSAYGFSSVTNTNKKVIAPAVTSEPSAPSDTTVGE